MREITDPSRTPRTPQLTTRECEELDTWSAVVGWETDYRQLDRGQFDAWFNMSLCDDLRVVDQFCSRQMFATELPPASHVALLIPLNQGDRDIFQGRILQQGEVAVMGPGSAGTYRTPPGLRMLTLPLPMSRLWAAFQATCQQELDPLVCETRIIHLSSSLFNRFIWIGRQVIDTTPRTSGETAPAIWQRELEASFVTSLINGLTGGDKSEPRRLTRMNRVRYVTAARDCIDAHLGDTLEIETLARAAGVSPRTLEYAFRDVCDTTPLRYIKIRRLHAARRRLLEAQDPATRVTDIALGHGFGHFGYFARDYHELFAEYPSETLATRR